MAWIVGDSFDYYGGHIDLGHSVWDTYDFATQAAFVTGTSTRFNAGQALKMQFRAPQLTKVFGSNEATVYIASAFLRPGVQSGSTVELYFELRDGVTAQCAICFTSGGTIVFKSGAYNSATILATYSAAFVQDTWNHFQFRVVIDPSAGTFTIRKNGSPTDTFAATGLNTRVSANSYTNVIALGNNNTSNGNIDDLLVYSAAGAAPNTWVGDVRAVCLPPVADTAVKVMTPVIATATCLGDTNTIGNGVVPANTICFSLGQTLANSNPPPRSGIVTTSQVTVNTAMTGHMKCALYLDVNQYPGPLLWTSNEITNPPSGVNVLTWPATMYLSSRNRYWVALLTDANVTMSTGGDTGVFYSTPTSYATGFPATAPAGMTTGPFTRPFTSRFTVSGNCTNVSESLANSDTDYVYSSNSGDEDLYDLDDLVPAAVNVLGVVSKVFFRKSDAGTRTGQLRLKSGATEVGGTDTNPSATYTYTYRVDTTDPNTGAAWSGAAINALQLGVKVTS